MHQRSVNPGIGPAQTLTYDYTGDPRYHQSIGAITRMSVADGGSQASLQPGGSPYALSSSSPAISSDGQRVAFQSNADNLVPNDYNGMTDVFVRGTGGTTRESVTTGGAESNGNSQFPRMSRDGGYVVFDSQANNLVAQDYNGYTNDIYLRERLVPSATPTTSTCESGWFLQRFG